MSIIDRDTTMLVRPMRPGDHDDILAIARELPEWFTPKGLEMIAYDLTWQQGLIAVDQDRPVGFVTYTCWEQVGYIGWMAIARQWHRRGLGRLLLLALEEQLVTQGVQALQVQTLGEAGASEAYARTRAFYLAMGFQEERTYHCDDSDWPETLVLRKDLRPHDSDPGLALPG